MQSTRRGSFSGARSEKTQGSKYSSTSGLSPRGHLERQAEFRASNQDSSWLSCPQSAGTLRSESEIRGTLSFLPQLEMRPSSNAPNPVESREAPPTSSFPDFSEPPPLLHAGDWRAAFVINRVDNVSCLVRYLLKLRVVEGGECFRCLSLGGEGVDLFA